MTFACRFARALYHLCMSSAAVLTAPLLTLALVSCGGGPESGTSGPGRSARAVPYTLSSPETVPAALGETHAAPGPARRLRRHHRHHEAEWAPSRSAARPSGTSSPIGRANFSETLMWEAPTRSQDALFRFGVRV